MLCDCRIVVKSIPCRIHVNGGNVDGLGMRHLGMLDRFKLLRHTGHDVVFRETTNGWKKGCVSTDWILWTEVMATSHWNSQKCERMRFALNLIEGFGRKAEKAPLVVVGALVEGRFLCELARNGDGCTPRFGCKHSSDDVTLLLTTDK